jgi:flotillin
MGRKRSAAAEIFRQQNQMDTPAPPSLVAEELADSAMPNFTRNRLPAPSRPRFGGDASRFSASPPPPPEPDEEDAFADEEPVAASAPPTITPTSEELQLEKGPIEVRETGFFVWKRVIVPPNAYVVHTRTGREQPVTLGLGISFRYNPFTDAYLVVPSAMQTIGVVANCISREKQGINVLAYVQWQISDFAIAYRKLDFSDRQDPLGIVNAQLREQAEAAIKDKIATMSIEEVLTDKAPVIEELTRRLIQVAEGRFQRDDGTNDEGLGIKIVTVQIKEAFVSSQKLWKHLQAPFRHEQEKSARFSYLNMQQEIRQRELESREQEETSEAESRVKIAQVTQVKTTEEEAIRLAERRKREENEQSNAIARAQAKADEARQLEAIEIARQIEESEAKSRLAAELTEREAERLTNEQALQQAKLAYEGFIASAESALALEKLRAEIAYKLTELEYDQQEQAFDHAREEQRVAVERLEREVENMISEAAVLKTWIEELPNLAKQLPTPPDVQEMRVLQYGTDGLDTAQPLMAFIASQLDLLKNVRDVLGTSDTPAKE